VTTINPYESPAICEQQPPFCVVDAATRLALGVCCIAFGLAAMPAMIVVVVGFVLYDEIRFGACQFLVETCVMCCLLLFLAGWWAVAEHSVFCAVRDRNVRELSEAAFRFAGK
jgi:hypothetical protein